MKAQNVKNTVIVPVGAKGGFVPQALAGLRSREEIQREGIECYRIFIRGLLDITDNVVDGRSCRPPIVRYDGDDPYLVVAADKGTATFSDIANAHRRRVRLLARRCIRLRRLRRLRPQEDGHHRARRLGMREAPLPRARDRHPVAGLHRRRHRRHGRRRVRQRHAAVAAHPAAGRLQPPAHLSRPGAGSGARASRARAAVQPAALELGGLRPQADLEGRRRVPARRQVRSRSRRRHALCSESTRGRRRRRRSSARS